MPANPKRLNNLQLKTLALLQEIAKHELYAEETADGDYLIRMMPEPHGDHFHIGPKVVLAKDASGLTNRAVHSALLRKGLIDQAPASGDIIVLKASLEYPTGIRDKILHGSDH